MIVNVKAQTPQAAVCDAETKGERETMDDPQQNSADQEGDGLVPYSNAPGLHHISDSRAKKGLAPEDECGNSMTKQTTAKQIESRLQAAIDRQVRFLALLREKGVDSLGGRFPEDTEEMRRECLRLELVYARQRDRDLRREDDEDLDQLSRMVRICVENAKLNMAWTVRYHSLARTSGRRHLLMSSADWAQVPNEESRRWRMLSLYIEGQQADLERSLGLDPDAERELERAIEAAREESDDPRAYDPLEDGRFRRRVLEYERALADRVFVLERRLERDFKDAFGDAIEKDVIDPDDDDVPWTLHWEQAPWEKYSGRDRRYVYPEVSHLV